MLELVFLSIAWPSQIQQAEGTRLDEGVDHALRPVEVLVVKFRGSEVNGKVVPALLMPVAGVSAAT